MHVSSDNLNRQMGALVPEGRLDSWKAIAAYLNRDVRTVRRWEQLGLPVRRVPGGRGTSVFAFTEEIDAWLKASEHQQSVAAPETAPSRPVQPIPTETSKVSGWLAPGIALGLLLAVAAVWRLRTPTYGAGDLRIQVTRQGITASDAMSDVVWRHPFDQRYTMAITDYGNPYRVVTGRHSAVYATTSFK